MSTLATRIWSRDVRSRDFGAPTNLNKIAAELTPLAYTSNARANTALDERLIVVIVLEYHSATSEGRAIECEQAAYNRLHWLRVYRSE